MTREMKSIAQQQLQNTAVKQSVWLRIFGMARKLPAGSAPCSHPFADDDF